MIFLNLWKKFWENVERRNTINTNGMLFCVLKGATALSRVCHSVRCKWYYGVLHSSNLNYIHLLRLILQLCKHIIALRFLLIIRSDVMFVTREYRINWAFLFYKITNIQKHSFGQPCKYRSAMSTHDCVQKNYPWYLSLFCLVIQFLGEVWK